MCIKASLYEKFGGKISHFWWRRQNHLGQTGWWEPWCGIYRMVCESDAEERLFQLLKTEYFFFQNSNIVLAMNLRFGQDPVWIAFLCSSWYQGGLKPGCWITWRLAHTCPVDGAGCSLGMLVSLHEAPQVISVSGMVSLPHTWHVVGFLPKKHLLRNKPSTSWALLITSLLMSYGIYSTISLCLRQSRGPSRLKRKGPRFHLPAGVLQSRKKRLWDGSSTWSESGCQGGNAEFPHHYPENGILMSLYKLLTKLSWPCPNNGKGGESHKIENIMGP